MIPEIDTDTSDNREDIEMKQSSNTATKHTDDTQWSFFNDDYFTDTDEQIFINDDKDDGLNQVGSDFQSMNILQKVRDSEYDFSSDWESIINNTINN